MATRVKKRAAVEIRLVLSSIESIFRADLSQLYNDSISITRPRLQSYLRRRFDKQGKQKSENEIFRKGLSDWLEAIVGRASACVEEVASLAKQHPEWEVSDPAAWGRNSAEDMIARYLEPRNCIHCGRTRPEHGKGVDHHRFSARSPVEKWFMVVCDGLPDFDRYPTVSGRPEPWCAPRFARCSVFRWHEAESDRRLTAQATSKVLKGDIFFFVSRTTAALKTVEHRVRIRLAQSVTPTTNTPGGTDKADIPKVVEKTAKPEAISEGQAAGVAERQPNSREELNLARAMLVEKIRLEVAEVSQAIELPEDYETRVRRKRSFAAFTTIKVCNRHPDLRDKLCSLKGTKKPQFVHLACEIAARSVSINGKPALPSTFERAQKEYSSQARRRLQQR